jgi:hypothetical protein
MGMEGEAMEKEGEGRTHLQMSRRTGVGYRLKVKWAVGRGKEGEAAGVLTRNDGLTLHDEVESII